MKKFKLPACLCAAALAAVSAGCKDDKEPQPAPPERPSAALELKSAGQTRFAFELRTENADGAAYTVTPAIEPENERRAEDIFASGTAADAVGGVYTVTGLEPDTEYTVRAAARNDGGYSEVAELAVRTLKPDDPEPPREYDLLVECDRFTGLYYGDIQTGAGTGNYYMAVTDIPFDDAGNSVGAGYIFYLDVYDELAAAASQAVLSAGEYAFDLDDTYAAGTFSNRYSYYGEAGADGSQVAEGKFLGGRITVESPAEGSLRFGADLVIMDGLKVWATNDGPAAFGNRVPDPAIDIYLDARSNAAVYKGDTSNDGLSDEWTLTLWNADKTIELFIQFCTACNDDISRPVIPDGTFTADEGFDFLPGTYIPGVSMMGMDLGTFIVSREGGANVKMFITGGTFSTVREGDVYTVTLDLTTGEGKSVAGSYTGPLVIENRAKEPIPDHSVTAERLWRAQYFGAANGYVHRYYVQLTDVQFEGDEAEPTPAGGAEGNEVALDFYGPASESVDDAVLPEGTYTVAFGEGMNTLGPGMTRCMYHPGGGAAPQEIFISAGSAEVKHTGAGYSVSLDAINLFGNRLTASYSGPIEFAYSGGIGMAPASPDAFLYSLRAQAARRAGSRSEAPAVRLRLP